MDDKKLAFWLMDYVDREVQYRHTEMWRIGWMDAVKAREKGDEEGVHKCYQQMSEELGFIKGMLALAKWINTQKSCYDIQFLDSTQEQRLLDLITATNGEEPTEQIVETCEVA
tara:strand:+ start:324 stop:662 length:339 start_codon:yes stop_codon:yes gene_type:complete